MYEKKISFYAILNSNTYCNTLYYYLYWGFNNYEKNGQLLNQIK